MDHFRDPIKIYWMKLKVFLLMLYHLDKMP